MDPVILDQLQAEEEKLKELYESVKPIVWEVKITGTKKVKEDLIDSEINYTAFVVHTAESKLYLMSCAHGDWFRWDKKKIHCRPLNGIAGEEFIVGKDVVVQPKCDMSLFEVPLEGGAGIVGKFGSGDLDVAERIMSIGNPGCCKATCMIGRVIYPCIADPKFTDPKFIADPKLDRIDFHTCSNHDSDYALNTKQPCRFAGHLFNKLYFRGNFKDTLKEDIDWVKHLKASLPILHCSGLVGGLGCSGSPIFNLKGEIVAMFICGADGFQVGVHVSSLKAFLEGYLKVLDEEENAELVYKQAGYLKDLGNIAKKRKKTQN